MSSIEKFNKTLTELLNNVKSNYTDLEKEITDNYKFPLEGTTYIDKFCNNCKNIEQDISTKNEIIFSKEYTLLDNVNFNKLWNKEGFDNDDKDIIWEYLHTLYIYSYEYKHNKDINILLNNLKNIELDSSELDQETKSFLNIIESLKNIDNIDIENSDIENNTIDDIMDDNNDNSNDNGDINMTEIFDGSIGKLANEIAQDIDPDTLNIENPSKLLEGLFSGNLDMSDDKSGIVNLVQNITEKIQNKISSGELNEQNLFNEANNVMSKLNQNNMFSNLFNNNSEEPPKDVCVNNVINKSSSKTIKNNETPQHTDNRQKLQEKRASLRKKLEEKKLKEKK